MFGRNSAKYIFNSSIPARTVHRIQRTKVPPHRVGQLSVPCVREYNLYSRRSPPALRSSRENKRFQLRVSGSGEDLPSRVSSPPFPTSYESLIVQAQRSIKSAIADKNLLVEVEFPPGGLASVAGDSEGNNELNATANYLRQICRAFETDGSAATTRVYFPDKTELQIATGGRAWASSDGARAPDNTAIVPTFSDWPGPVDYLTDPSFVTESGLGRLFGAKRLSGQVGSRRSTLGLGFGGDGAQERVP